MRTCFSFAPHISPLSFTHTVDYYSRELEYYFSRQKNKCSIFLFSGFCVLLFCVKCLTLPFRFCCVCDVKKKSTRLENNIGFTLSLSNCLLPKNKNKKHITTLKEPGIYIFLKDTTLEALNKTKKKFIHFARQFHQQFIDYGHGLFTT